MTYYPGGKKILGKEIAEIIHLYSTNIEDFDIKGYCEPFCGMLGVYQNIPDLFSNDKIKFYAGDRNPYLIKLWKGIKNGFRPPTKCSKTEYYDYKKNDTKTLKSIFLGFACSIRGVFRSTYIERNIETQSQQCIDIGKKIKNVNFLTGDYSIFSKLKNCIIYCDPPYKNTGTPYSVGNEYNTNFDYNNFIQWCLKMSENNVVFISEYSKPCRECKLIWKNKKEKLYIITT